MHHDESVLFFDDQAVVTPSLVTISGKSYAVPLINSVSIAPTPALLTGAGIAGIVIGAIAALFGAWAWMSWEIGPIFIFLGIFGIAFGTTLKEPARTVLSFSMSSGEPTVMMHPDPAYLQRLKAAVEQAMMMERSAAADSVKDCPMCAETVKSAAMICRYCGHRFSTGQVISIV